MTDRIMLIGGPDSGKTNYLGRFWQKLSAGNGALSTQAPPADIRYVEEALSHLLLGEFAPRSDLNLEEGGREFEVAVVHSGSAEPVEIIVPDVSGELWKKAVETTELPAAWMDRMRSSDGALLFVRVHSGQNVEPPDWVASQKLLELVGTGDAGTDYKIPTQVSLCELLRFLEYTLGTESGARGRVAVVITAWDLLDGEAASASPETYLRKQFPLFAGRLTDTTLDVRVFGVSILGGDLGDGDFKKKFLDGDMAKAGYAVSLDGAGSVVKTDDISAPVAWVVEGVGLE